MGLFGFKLAKGRHLCVCLFYLSGMGTDKSKGTKAFSLVGKVKNTGLIELPNIGKGIAAAIEQLVTTGQWAQLERLRGTLDPVHLFQTVPGIGPKTAEDIATTLHIDTLEALEVAAHDGRLGSLKGIVLANDDPANPVQQDRAAAHVAG